MEQKKKIEFKKGIALNQAFGAVLTLVLVAVLVIVAIVMFVNLNVAFAGTSSVTVSGETISAPSSTGVTLGGASNCSSAGFGITAANNATAGGILIQSGNFSVNSNTGVVINLTSEFLDSDWIINYSYTWGSEACTASDDLITQFATYPALVGLVGTIIFLGIVIGVLVASFVFGKKDGQI